MKIKVSVPATSANVGSGFDALGLAVTLYNTVTFEDSEVLEISASDGTRIPRGESNLVYRSAKGLFEKVGKQIPPLKITQTNPIPMARGLGSSSACIIAGLLGAHRMLGDVLNTQELLTLATAIEGHPDNVAPALLGGLTAAASIPPRAVQGLSASPQTGRFPPRCIIMILSNRRLRMGRIGAHSWRGTSCLPIRWPLAIRFLPPRWMTIIPAPAAFIA